MPDGERSRGRVRRGYARSCRTERLGPELAPVLGPLRAVERDALYLHACTGLADQEIAHATAVPIGAVRSRIRRARSRLHGPLITPGRDVIAGQLEHLQHARGLPLRCECLTRTSESIVARAERSARRERKTSRFQPSTPDDLGSSCFIRRQLSSQRWNRCCRRPADRRSADNGRGRRVLSALAVLDRLATRGPLTNSTCPAASPRMFSGPNAGPPPSSWSWERKAGAKRALDLLRTRFVASASMPVGLLRGTRGAYGSHVSAITVIVSRSHISLRSPHLSTRCVCWSGGVTSTRSGIGQPLTQSARPGMVLQRRSVRA